MYRQATVVVGLSIFLILNTKIANGKDETYGRNENAKPAENPKSVQASKILVPYKGESQPDYVDRSSTPYRPSTTTESGPPRKSYGGGKLESQNTADQNDKNRERENSGRVNLESNNNQETRKNYDGDLDRPAQPEHSDSQQKVDSQQNVDVVSNGNPVNRDKPVESSKCPHVRCESPPVGPVCSEYGGPASAGFAHSECCPIHTCQREDGSTFYHFGIEIEEVPYKTDAEQAQTPQNQQNQDQDPNERSFYRSQNRDGPGVASSSSYNNNYFQAGAGPQIRQNPYQVRPPFFLSGSDNRSPVNNNYNPGNNRRVNAPAVVQPRPGIFYPGAHPQFGGQGSASARQSQNRYSPSPYSANSFSPVGFEDPGLPLDRPHRNPGASPFPFGPMPGQYPFSDSGPAPAQGSWSRFKRNVFGALPAGVRSPIRP